MLSCRLEATVTPSSARSITASVVEAATTVSTVMKATTAVMETATTVTACTATLAGSLTHRLDGESLSEGVLAAS